MCFWKHTLRYSVSILYFGVLIFGKYVALETEGESFFYAVLHTQVHTVTASVSLTMPLYVSLFRSLQIIFRVKESMEL